MLPGMEGQSLRLTLSDCVATSQNFWILVTVV